MRYVLFLAISIVFLSSGSQSDELISRPRPTFHVLFSNDTTNTITCGSGGFQISQLWDSVDVTVGNGIDVHMLQPGLGWVPWWDSEIYPYKEHADWYRQKTGMNITSYGQKMLQGQDIVACFVWRCRVRGISPWISFRMNDYHMKEYVLFPKETMQRFRRPTSMAISRFYDEHPEYRLDTDPLNGKDITKINPEVILTKYRQKMRTANLWNWAIPQVREHKLAFIEEICRNYDIDGLELDFMRHPYYFRTSETTHEQRVQTINAFIIKVRALLNETARENQYRWLGVRVPPRLNDFSELGIDIKKFHESGVDVFNLACDDGYHMEQQSDLSRIHELYPDAPLFLETTHITTRRESDSKSRRILATEEQFYTTAHLAYSRGAQGVSSFNFQYYCLLGADSPYHVYKNMDNPQWLAAQPQHYFLSRYDAKDRRVTKIEFEEAVFALDMEPRVYALTDNELKEHGYKVRRGWSQDGRLRIQSITGKAFDNNEWKVWFNGHKLEPTDDISDPYPNPYRKLKPNMGKEGLYPPEPVSNDIWKAWIVPVNIVKAGINEIKIVKEHKKGKISYLDLAIK